MRRIPVRIAIAVAGLTVPLVLAAQAPRPTTRDSSGVQIVAYDSTVVPPRFELRDRGLEIGSEPGAELARVAAALRMPNGKILVADAGPRHLMRFGADGRFEKIIGRDGQGPGEFERLYLMGRHGPDAVGTYDFGLARYSVFSDSGFLRQVRLEGSPEIRIAEIVPLGVLSNGALIVTGGGSFPLGAEGPARLERLMSPVLQYRADGTPGRIIGRYPGVELEVAMVKDGPVAGSFANGLRLFGRGGALGLAQGHIVHIDNDRFQFDVIDTAGRLVRRVRRVVANQPVRPSDVATYIQEQVDAARPQSREAVRRRIEGQTPARTFPALQARVVIDASSRIWLAEYRHPGDKDEAWWIFTVDGRIVGRVNVPVSLTISDAGTDWVLGTWRDEDGVQTVRLYDLRPAAGRD